MGMFVTGLANKVERNINKKLWEMVVAILELAEITLM